MSTISKIALAGALAAGSFFIACKPASKPAASRPLVAAEDATCSGDNSYCNACKNCKYCKHCSKDGGTCKICK